MVRPHHLGGDGEHTADGLGPVPADRTTPPNGVSTANDFTRRLPRPLPSAARSGCPAIKEEAQRHALAQFAPPDSGLRRQMMPRIQEPVITATRVRLQAGTRRRTMVPRMWCRIVMKGRRQKEERRSRSPQRPKSCAPTGSWGNDIRSVDALCAPVRTAVEAQRVEIGRVLLMVEAR